MIHSSAQTVRQVLRQRPLAAEILEKEFGHLLWERMDSSLANLCAATGVDSFSLQESLIALPPLPEDTDWDKIPVYGLIDHLTLAHASFRDAEMPAILAMLIEERLPAYPDGYVIKLLQQEFRHFQVEFLKHMAEEEDFLFPKIMRNEACFRFRNLGPEVYRGSVNLYLKLETHKPEEEFKRMIISIREKLRNQHLNRPAAEMAERTQSALDAFAKRLMSHADLETGILFPRAGRLEQVLYESSVPGLSRYPGDQR
jgi:iron-sulfur cluster repair protein YtfE (RIC family)